MRASKVLFLAIILAAAAGGAYYFYTQGPQVKVDVVRPARGKAVQAVYATGTVEPVVMLPVAPRLPARLVELLADEGQKVEKGAVLARLEDTDIAKELTEAAARVELAKKEYDRKSSLSASGAISKQAIDQALTDLQTSQAAVDKIKATLDYLKLLSPEDGFVIRRDGEEGEFIPAGQDVFWVACCGFRVSAEVDEEDISLVQPGQKVLVSADAFPGETFEAVVKSITPKGDPVARSYRVRIELPAETKLMIGMTAENNIIAREKEGALLVPASAVRGNYLWVVRAGKAYRQDVKTGMQNNKATEILEGAGEGDIVIDNPPGDLADGQAVRAHMREWMDEAP